MASLNYKEQSKSEKCLVVINTLTTTSSSSSSLVASSVPGFVWRPVSKTKK